MDKFKEFNEESKQLGEALGQYFMDVKDEYLPNSDADFEILKKALDSLANGTFSESTFNELKKIENSEKCWRTIKQALLCAKYRKC